MNEQLIAEVQELVQEAPKARPLLYADRCERYARQRGWIYDEHRLSIDRLTPRQRRRALRKERHAWPLQA